MSLTISGHRFFMSVRNEYLLLHEFGIKFNISVDFIKVTILSICVL